MAKTAQADEYVRLRHLISDHLGIDEQQITVDSTFQEDLAADSLDGVELAMAAEEEFGVTISDADAEKFVTVGDMLKFLMRKAR